MVGSKVNAGPLQTLFSPPTTCLGVITSGSVASYSLFMGHWGEYTVAATRCYPSSTTEFDFLDNYYWSPGYCPYGYSTACSYTPISFGSEITASLCCPTLDGTTATLPSSYSFLTITPLPTATVWADGVPVAWESTDLAVLAMISATSMSSLIPTPLPSPSSLPTITLPPTQTAQGDSNSSPGLSNTQKIIVAAAVPGSIFILCLLFLAIFLRYRRWSAAQKELAQSRHNISDNGFLSELPVEVEKPLTSCRILEISHELGPPYLGEELAS